jgi:hypothetical protein
MQLKYNSYLNELAIYGQYHDRETFKKLQSEFQKLSIYASMPYQEYNPVIHKLEVHFSDVRFQLSNSLSQMELVKDILTLLRQFGLILNCKIDEFELDKTHLLKYIDEYVQPSITPWLTNTKEYQKLFSVPYETAHNAKNRNDVSYTISLTGLWSEEEVKQLVLTFPPSIQELCLIREYNIRFSIAIPETNSFNGTVFELLQEFVKEKFKIHISEFGNYRFYQP